MVVVFDSLYVTVFALTHKWLSIRITSGISGDGI